jgi:hypothetical protein
MYVYRKTWTTENELEQRTFFSKPVIIENIINGGDILEYYKLKNKQNLYISLHTNQLENFAKVNLIKQWIRH